MKKVLRVSTYPTLKFKTMGLNSYMISGMDRIETIYLSPLYSKEVLPIKKNTKLFFETFLIVPSPTNLVKRVFHEFRRLYHIFNFSIKGIRYIHKYKVDMVHIHSPMFFLIAIYAKIKKITCFITYHGIEFKKIYKLRIMGLVFNYIFDKTFSLSSDILVYRNKYPDYSNNFVTINNAVDKKIYFDKNLKRKRQIIAVGRLEKQKGYKYLINGFYHFQKENLEYNLLIVGEGQLRQSIQNQILELNLSNKISLVGRLDQKDLVMKYNESEIFILSSLWEGFPKVLLEAISCGCKVITTKIDATPLIMGENYEYLISEKSSDQISKSFSKIIQDKEVKTKISEKIISQFSWSKIKKEMEKIYLEA